MFEEFTFKRMMERLLKRVTETAPNLDTRVGSIIYSALGPAAAELANMYIEADAVLDETFADTASWDFLVRRCAERGLTPKQPTAAVWKGSFDVPIAAGTRFSCGTLDFIVTESLAGDYAVLECETKGEAGNTAQGALIPIEYIAGLTRAELTELLIPGEDLEDIEHLRTRYFESFASQAFGGNIADYKQKVNGMDGVGGCKVYPVWNGGGTVKVVIISSMFDPPTAALVDSVQLALDPPEHHAEGLGLAPIGHVVTVEGVQSRKINVAVTVILENGYVWEDVSPYVREAADGYFLELAQDWQNSTELVVRVSQLETRLLVLDGILDVLHTTLNGTDGNLTLEADEIPTGGTIHGEITD